MPLVDYPAALSKTHWDRKKGALPPGSEVETALKLLQKKHEAVDWKLFEPGWESQSRTAEALSADYRSRDQAYRAKVFPLKSEAAVVSQAAQKLGKDKGLSKLTADAVKTLVEAVKQYDKAIVAGLDAIEAAHHRAVAALAAQARDEAEADDEPTSALVEPRRLLAQLQGLKRDAKRRVHFALGVPADGGNGFLVMHTRTAGRSLFSQLQKDVGARTGAHGQAWLADNTLFLQVDKAVTGLVKKARAGVKACGFKVGRIVLADESGAVVEQDHEPDHDTPGTTGMPAAPAATPAERAAALADWQQAREQAVTALKRVAQDIAAMRDPESAPAIVQLQAVIKNLTAEPADRRQVVELQRWLDQDDVVLDVCEYAVDLRTPLLAALARLHAVQPD